MNIINSYESKSLNNFNLHNKNLFLNDKKKRTKVFLIEFNGWQAIHIIFSYLVSSLFIFGFPKSHDAVMKERISVQNSVTLTCSLNASIFNLDPGECETSDLEICNDIFSEYSKTKVVNRQIDVVKIKTLDSYELTKNNSILKVNNKNECEKMIFEGWKIKDYYEITKKPPFVNLLAFFFPVIIFFINIFKFNKK